MGTWSAEPFGNDSAADWAFELDDAEDWTLVRVALDDLLAIDGPDQDIETIAIAAAEVVAHGLGKPTQQDPYVESVDGFVSRAGQPPVDLPALAMRVLDRVASESELEELWEDDVDEWKAALARLRAVLSH